MNAHATRRVGQLRVRAPDVAVARRTAIRLEDALRTASLPDAAGRVLLVRRLDLGRVDARATALQLARRVEQAFARSGARCVHALDPQAAAADAVWFRDTLEAQVERARRVLRTGRSTAWFWRLLSPRIPDDADAATALRVLLCSLALRPEAPIAVPRWLAAVDALGGLACLSQVLSVDDARGLAEVSGLRDPPTFESFDSPATIPPAAARARADQRPRPQTSSIASAQAVETMLRRIARGAVRSNPLEPPRGAMPDPVAASPSIETGAAHARTCAAGACPAGAPSEAGGLLLLLPVLARLGYAEWRQANPEWEPIDLARRVLARVLARLRVRDRDPAWALVEPDDTLACTPASFVAPARWRGDLALSPARVEQTGARPLQARVAQAWQLAAQRWLSRHAGLSLRGLVLRPGVIAHTPTHVDLRFDPAQADLRIRRAGLDLDPGWLAWFGRVVSIHYSHQGGP